MGRRFNNFGTFLSGRAGRISYLSGGVVTIIGPGGTTPVWLTDNLVIANTDAGVAMFDVWNPAQGWTPLDARGVNGLEAGNGRWAGWQAAVGGMFGSISSPTRRVSLLGADERGGGAPDGTLASTGADGLGLWLHRADGTILEVKNPDGSVFRGPAYQVQVIDRNSAVWDDAAGHGGATGVELGTTLPVQRLRVVGNWRVFFTGAWGVVAHPANQPQLGRVVAGAGVLAYYHEAFERDGVLYVGYSRGPGELPEEAVVVAASSLPIVDLTAPTPPDPEPPDPPDPPDPEPPDPPDPPDPEPPDPEPPMTGQALKTVRGTYIGVEDELLVQVAEPQGFVIERHGINVALKGPNGRYVAAEPDGFFRCNRETASDDQGSWELFLRNPANESFRVRWNQLFITAAADGSIVQAAHPQPIIVEGDAPPPQPPTGDSFSFQTTHGGWLNADAAPQVREGQTKTPFTLLDVGPKVAIRAPNGKWLATNPEGVVTADRDEPSLDLLKSWELFVKTAGADGKIGFKGVFGKFLSVADDGLLRCNQPVMGSWESFRLEPMKEVVVSNPLVGRVRRVGKCFGDDTGPRKLLGHSWFPALRDFTDRKSESLKQLDDLAAKGYQFVRVFLIVGGWDDFWNGMEVTPVPFTKLDGNRNPTFTVQPLPDYWGQVRRFLEELKARKLKAFVTTGDMQIIMPKESDRIFFVQQFGHLLNDVGADVCAFFECANEGFQNWSSDQAEGYASVLRAFNAICPTVLGGTTSSAGDPEDPVDIARLIGYDYHPETETFSDRLGLPLGYLTLHGTRTPVTKAIERCFTLSYWGRNKFPLPILQGEPIGPDGTVVGEVYPPHAIADKTNLDGLFGLYATMIMAGQACTFFSGPSVRRAGGDWLDDTFLYSTLAGLLSHIPEDVSSWSTIIHGGRPEAPITAEQFADTGSGPERVNQVTDGSRFVCVVSGGTGAWKLVQRRPVASWKVLSATQPVQQGTGAFPPMDASMTSRVIVGTFA